MKFALVSRRARARRARRAEGLEPEEPGSLDRYAEMALGAFNMSMAWAVFFATRWAVAHSGLCGRGAESEILLALLLALLLSLGAFAATLGLDWLADADWTPPRVDAVIKQLIGALGILVGFSWEQAFDASVAAVSEGMPLSPSLTKVVLAVLSCSVIMPAWKRYLLPMSVFHGWRFGFIPDHATLRLNKRCKATVKHFEEV